MLHPNLEQFSKDLTAELRKRLIEGLGLDEFRVKVVEDETLRAVHVVLVDKEWETKEQERIRSLPPPVNSHRRGHKHESRTKTKSVPDVREQDERRRLSQVLKMRMVKQVSRARGVGAQGASSQGEASGQGGQANQDPPGA